MKLIKQHFTRMLLQSYFYPGIFVESTKKKGKIMRSGTQYTAFEGDRRVAHGPLDEVARAVKAVSDARPLSRILVFNAQTSEPLDIDCRGSVAEVLARIVPAGAGQDGDPAAPPPAAIGEGERNERSGRGRPRLGVVAREVTLLPRHWDWLASQPGGASVALRKLVEQARRSSQNADRRRAAQDAAFRFMSALAGDRAGYEEAVRALFAGDGAGFGALIKRWPADVGAHLHELAAPAFASEADDRGTEAEHA